MANNQASLNKPDKEPTEEEFTFAEVFGKAAAEQRAKEKAAEKEEESEEIKAGPEAEGKAEEKAAEKEEESEEIKAKRYQEILLGLGFHEKKSGDKVRYIVKDGEVVIGRTFDEQHPTGKFWAIQNDKFLPEWEMKELAPVKRFYAIREGKDEIPEIPVKEEEKKKAIVIKAEQKPNLVILDAQQKADSLYAVVEKQHLYQEIWGKKYLQLEAWQTLGKFCNITGSIEWTKPIDLWDVKGFEARAVIKDNEGNTISAAESMCMSDEENWKNKPIFQLRSMAQTRALSKAYRSCLSFIVSLAGYAVTPAEEVDEEH